MKKPYMRIACLSLAAVSGLAIAQFQPPVFINRMTSFGGDGDLSVGEAETMAAAQGFSRDSILNTDRRSRGMAFNPATGNLIIATRGSAEAPGNFITVLDGNTGGFIRRLSSTGITGGGFPVNMTDVSDDGQVFVGSLRHATGHAFRLYRWASDSTTDAPTMVFDNAVRATVGPRVGDTLDVMGSGNNVRIVAGHGHIGTDRGRGYLLLDQSGPNSFTPTLREFGTAVDGDFRLGTTWSHFGTRVLGTQGAAAAGDLLHVTDPNAPAHLGVGRLNWHHERGLAARFINGFHMLATVDTINRDVRIYHIDDALNPVYRASFIHAAGPGLTNPDGTTSIHWGSVNGKDATLYVMSTNHGIQAYNVEVVPEPATLLALGAGVAALVARRRRKK